jgi:predicted dehydrogenase
MADRVRWGVVGTGGIAAAFADDLRRLPDAALVAVGSRSAAAADAFGERYGVARRHASYAALAADPDVDVVYVATPHPVHREAALLAIEAGKAVLVEKPFTLNAAEAAEVIGAARRHGVFLMEAMWTRFLPHMAQIRDLVGAGALGDLRAVHADHGQWFLPDASHRLFAPELGGGALLDLGVYPVSFASMMLGTPTDVTATSQPAFTGVDAQTTVVLRYDEGRQAVLTMSLEALGTNRAAIIGTDARLEIDARWYGPTSFTVVRRDGSAQRHERQHEDGKGLRHEAAEVGRCLREGRLESEVLPLEETLSVMATMDEVRRQIGLTYPGE